MFPQVWRKILVWAVASAVLWPLAAAPAAAFEATRQSPAALAFLAPAAVIVYHQPPRAAGGLLQSSLRDPDGSDTDQWVWDNFTLSSTQAISEIRWSGGHDPARLGSGGPVVNFTLAIYASIPAGTEPDLSGPPLVRYEVGSNAGETAGPVLGGVQMYDYGFILPTPFTAQGGTTYWVQIEAFQSGPSPDWGLTAGSGGDGKYFRRVAGEFMFQRMTGDASFTLLATRVNGYRGYLPLISG